MYTEMIRVRCNGNWSEIITDIARYNRNNKKDLSIRNRKNRDNEN